MKAILLDDEPYSLKALQLLLETHCPDVVDIIATCTDSEAGLELIRQQQPDLVFLDIEMPRLNGFQVLEALGNQRFMFVFTTAYDEYAVRAFRFSALDYLLKPIEPDELKMAVAKANEHLQLEKQQLEILQQHLSHPSKSITGKIALALHHGFVFVEINSIMMVEGDGNYATVHMMGEKPILITKSIGDVEAVLQGGTFFRVHRKYLVNLNHIREYVRSDGGYLIMQDGAKIPIARSHRDGFVRLFSRL